MEFALNLVWACIAFTMLALVYLGAARRHTRLSLASTMLLAVLLCLILLPVISITDDVLAARQATLPLTGQTWRLVSQEASVGLDLLLAVGAYLLLLISLLAEARRGRQTTQSRHTLVARLVRAQRLRPPLCAA